MTVPRQSMCQHFRRLCVLLVSLWSAHALAEPVSVQHDGLTLNGEWTRAAAAPPDHAIVLVHGTLAHHRMELVANLQALLAERDLSALSITLSLGIDNRTGMFHCTQVHRHRHLDALPEIGRWLHWLTARGVTRITLLGHSRGANQVVRYALAHQQAAVANVVLVAPMTHDEQRSQSRYEARYARPLGVLLAEAKAVAPDTLIQAPFLYCGQSSVSAAAFASYHGEDAAFDTPALLARLDLPTLVVAGGADETVPDLVGRLPSLRVHGLQTLVIEDADHFFLDLHAEDLTDAVAEFLVRQAK